MNDVDPIYLLRIQVRPRILIAHVKNKSPYTVLQTNSPLTSHPNFTPQQQISVMTCSIIDDLAIHHSTPSHLGGFEAIKIKNNNFQWIFRVIICLFATVLSHL